MHRTVRLLVILSLAFASSCLPGRPDGMLIARSEVVGSFSEQVQLAVVEVSADHTAQVDLFISLLDTSGEPHEVSFLLPLQADPTEVSVQETFLGPFTAQKTRPLDALLHRATRDAEAVPEAIRRAGLLGSVFGGPFALAAQWGARPPGLQAAGGFRGGSGPHPSRSLRTEHSKVDIYRALDADQLASLAGLGELPESVRSALTAYLGRPFALVELRTDPVPGVGPDGAAIASERHPGIHLRFDQALLPEDGGRVYHYPLGTGQGWEQPIPLTTVYVTGPDHLSLQVDFPDRPRSTGMLHYKMGKYSWREESIAYAAEGRQVHLASYYQANPGEDVAVRLFDEGPSEFAREEHARRWALLTAWTGFPAVALLTWLLVFAVLIRPVACRDRRPVWRALAHSYAVAYLIALGPALLVVYSAARPWRFFLYSSDRSLLLHLAAGVPLSLYETRFLLTAGALLGLTLVGLVCAIALFTRPTHRGFVFRSLIAAAVAGTVYALIWRAVAAPLVQ
jgi:hypothetical protein